MAEKYGVIPKRFTREWWDYFWTYYKWHTIAILAIIIAVSGTVYQKVTAPKYDLVLTYAGEKYIQDDTKAEIEKKLEPLCDDVNGNGERLLDFLTMDFTQQSLKDPQYAYAMEMKLQLSLAEDDAYIYIFDKSIIDRFAGENEKYETFAQLDEWLDAPADEASIYKNVAVSLENNKLFSELGMDMTDSWLLIRYKPREDQKKQESGYKAAINLANAILNY